MPSWRSGGGALRPSPPPISQQLRSMATTSKLRPAEPVPNSGALPPDAPLFEILLCLPAKELCRLCAVCRPWCSLLSDPHFIPTHMTRQPEPLIVLGGNTLDHNKGIHCEIRDPSRRIVNRIFSTSREKDERVVSAQDNLACVAKGLNTYRMQSLATGDVFALPQELSEEHKAHVLGFSNYRVVVVFGQVASTEHTRCVV